MLSQKTLSSLLLGFLKFLIFKLSDKQCKAQDSKPNIILIMADDMGYSDIGCYGGEIQTPNIDQLAEDGLRFTQFYNASRCCPTRASLLTGLYQHQAGIGFMTEDLGYDAYQGHLSKNSVTLAEALKKGGYNTMISGKWHVGGNKDKGEWPFDRGFDETFSLIGGASDYWDPGLMSRNGEKWKPEDTKRYQNKEFYMTDAISNYGVKFIEQYGKREKPFFLYLSYTAPHFPLHAWQKDIEKYEGTYAKGWDQLRRERYERQLEIDIIKEKWALSPRDNEIKAWENVSEKKKKDMRKRMQVYAAQIDRMDQGIGKVMDEVRKMGIIDNTLVLFLSDNGGNWEGGPWGWDWGEGPPGRSSNYWSTYGQSWGNASNTPFRLYKHWVHEGGIATPLIAHWPKVIKQQGKITREPGHIIDLMTTFCDVADIKYPEKHKDHNITPMEGKSLLPIFKGQTREGHEALFWEHHGNKAVRMGKWKLVTRFKDENWHLYNLEKDRTELRNLSNQYPEIVKEMTNKYQKWAERCGVRPWPVKENK